MLSSHETQHLINGSRSKLIEEFFTAYISRNSSGNTAFESYDIPDQKESKVTLQSEQPLVAQDEDHIRKVAYAIWKAEGSPHGKADNHWMQAVAQVTHRNDSNTGDHNASSASNLQDEAMPTEDRVVVRKSNSRTLRKRTES